MSLRIWSFEKDRRPPRARSGTYTSPRKKRTMSSVTTASELLPGPQGSADMVGGQSQPECGALSAGGESDDEPPARSQHPDRLCSDPVSAIDEIQQVHAHHRVKGAIREVEGLGVHDVQGGFLLHAAQLLPARGKGGDRQIDAGEGKMRRRSQGRLGLVAGAQPDAQHAARPVQIERGNAALLQIPVAAEPRRCRIVKWVVHAVEIRLLKSTHFCRF